MSGEKPDLVEQLEEILAGSTSDTSEPIPEQERNMMIAALLIEFLLRFLPLIMKKTLPKGELHSCHTTRVKGAVLIELMKKSDKVSAILTDFVVPNDDYIVSFQYLGTLVKLAQERGPTEVKEPA
jgi:hypothetical protein